MVCEALLLGEGEILQHIGAKGAGLKTLHILLRGDGNLAVDEGQMVRMLHDVGANRVIRLHLVRVVRLRRSVQQAGELIRDDMGERM